MFVISSFSSWDSPKKKPAQADCKESKCLAIWKVSVNTSLFSVIKDGILIVNLPSSTALRAAFYQDYNYIWKRYEVYFSSLLKL